MTRTSLFYSVRPSITLKFLGYSIFAIGLSSLVPAAVSLIFQEWSSMLSYLGAAFFSMSLGLLMTKIHNGGKIRFNEAVAIVCISYLYAVLNSAIPMYFTALSFEDAVFEAVSGITTTGLSVITDWGAIPNSIFFARAWLQWIGGLGIVLFSIALLLNQGEITKRLGAIQSDHEDVLGGSKNFSRIVILTYCFFTFVGIVAMLLVGTNLFEAILLVFSSVSTGGFSNNVDSIRLLSDLQKVIITVLAFFCAFSFPCYYRFWKGGLRFDLQAAQIIALFLISSLLAIALGATFNDWILAFSSQTTTGFSSSDLSELTNGKKMLLSFSMLIGGGVGSTAGGFKIVRLFLFFVFLRTLIIRQTQSKHAYFKPVFFKTIIEEKQIQYALALILTYVCVVAISWLCFLYQDYDPMNSLFEVISAVGTVGLSVGVSDNQMPIFLKTVLCVDMLFGRLEIFPWLIFLYPRTFFGQRLEG